MGAMIRGNSIRLSKGFVIIVIAWCMTLSAARADEPAIPGADAKKAALHTVREVYRAEYASAKTSEQKAALANILIEKAKETADESAARYVLLTEAQTLATQAGDSDLLLSATTAIANYFQQDSLQLRADALVSMLKLTKVQNAQRPAILSSAALVDEAISAERTAIAKQLTDAMTAASRQARDPELSTLASSWAQNARTASDALSRLDPARKKLQSDATDGPANLAVGSYLCFIKNDWSSGLPLLAICSDEPLKALANRDLANSTDGDALAKLGDDWWALAKKKNGINQLRIQSHAVDLYQNAIGSLSGLNKSKVEKRLMTAQEAMGGGSVARSKKPRELLRQMDGAQENAQKGVVVLELNQRISTSEHFRPPIIFRIVAQTNSTNIRFSYAAKAIILNWELNPDELRIDGGPAGGRHQKNAGRIPVNTWVNIDLLVLPDSMTITLNGEQRYFTKADFSKVNDPLEIFPANGSVIQVKSVQVASP